MSRIKVNDSTITLENYKKMEVIGNGPNGYVYKITHLKTNKIYAAKELKLFIENLTESFKRKFYICTTLNNPAFIEFIGYSLTDFDGNDFPVIVTKYMENGSLSDVFRKIHKN